MVKERLTQLRRKMYENGLEVYYLNTQDYHLSEYIPEHFKTLRYFSGFTGSMATMVITFDEAYIFVDGRYHVQADKQCTPNGIKVMKLGTDGVKNSDAFMIDNFNGKKIGLDGKVVSAKLVNRLKKAGLSIVSIDIYSDIYLDRPKLTKEMIYEIDSKYTGLTRLEKLNIVKRGLDGKCHITGDLTSIAYILNLRGNDIAYTPVFMSFLVFYDNDIYFFVHRERLSDIIIEDLNRDGVIIKDYDEYYDFIKIIKNTIILIDLNKINYETYDLLDTSSNRVYDMRSVIEDMKATKNNVEVKNARLAHIYDGVAMVRFMKWLKEVDKTTLNEYDVKVKLNRFRLEYKAFDLSFEPIVAYNANAAMMHYSPTADNNTKLENEGILLVDSGGQYFEGTTDITRTFALGKVDDKIKYWFSLVLRCMFNLEDVQFLEGLCGNQLDILARKDLWALGVDYRCGTGHGVGHILAVHETPPNIRYTIGGGSEVALKPGHIFSDEPGVYFEGEFGIRCENMITCVKGQKTEYGQFLRFEPLTLVPFDLELIDKEVLGDKVASLNAYHQLVYDTLSPYLSDEERAFLKERTRSI